MTTIGSRIFPNRFGLLRLPHGGYGRDLKGRWWVRPPGEDAYQICGETVVEHPNGTITVAEGINGHGVILLQGVWRMTEEQP